MRITKKQFEEHLNQPNLNGVTGGGWNNRSGARSRPYGTWLRNQDREKFNVDFEEWRKQKALAAH